MSGRAPDPLHTLRRAVDDLHRAVDERSSLGSSGSDVHRYGSALVVLARVLPEVERELIRSGNGRMTIAPLTPLLLDDVRSLGLDDRMTPRLTARYDDAAAWWGGAYVLHGSRLGATVIADRLATDLPDAPRSYFAEAARDAARTWARFRVAVREAFSAGHVDLGRAVASARAVFEALLVEFDRSGSMPTGDGRVA